jgi:hypothetical protein
MNDPSRLMLDGDPPRDESLARLLRAEAGRGPEADVNWERLHAAIMRGARAAATGSAASGRDWWEVVVGWGRIAAAASVAAMLAAGLLLWRTGLESAEVGLADNSAPESVALARVVDAYPNDAVLSSLLQAARDDDFTSWGIQ